jgi:hypothetical protein
LARTDVVFPRLRRERRQAELKRTFHGLHASDVQAEGAAFSLPFDVSLAEPTFGGLDVIVNNDLVGVNRPTNT